MVTLAIKPTEEWLASKNLRQKSQTLALLQSQCEATQAILEYVDTGAKDS